MTYRQSGGQQPSVWRDAKGRTWQEHHDAWIAWRKRIVDEHFPEMCSCRIGMVGNDRVKKTKCCELVPCGMRIKKAYYKQHLKECMVCSKPYDPNAPERSDLPPIGRPI